MNESIKTENEQQKLQIEQLKRQNKQLMEEQKESRLRIEELENEVEILKSQNLDVNNYETWKWQEILQWIMTLENHKFKEYEQDLKINLSVEQPSGSDLNEVNEGDIRRWGITKFCDIKILCYNIRQMVNYTVNDTNDIPSVANEEGAITGAYFK